MMNRLLAVTGLVALSAVEVWAGTIQIHDWPWLRPKVDPNVLTPLVRQTTDPNASTRARAIEELGRLRAKEAFGVVAGHLFDKAVVQTEAGPATVAAVACAALGLLEERRAVPQLIPLLEDEELRDIAARALYVLRHPFRFQGLQTIDLLRKDSPPAGRPKPSDLVDPAFGSDPVQWRLWWTREELPGREVVVRVYKDPVRDPRDFTLVNAQVTGRSVPLSAIPGADPCSVVLICARDQRHEDLRLLMGRWVVVQCIAQGGSLPVPDCAWPLPGGSPIPERWLIEDALGNPMYDASVEVWLSAFQTVRGVRQVCFGRWTASEGSIEAIGLSGGFRPKFIVLHRNYGKADVAGPLAEDSHVRVPLVPLDSEAGRRAIWGIVVDESGTVIQGARVRCDHVRTLGEGLINLGPASAFGEAVTDANGFFALYFAPDERHTDWRGSLIPPGSRYSVTVRVPAASGLAPFYGNIENGAPVRITLRPIRSKVRTLVFKTEDGILREPGLLQRIVINVQLPGGAPLRYDYAQWSAGDRMPEGQYTATLQDDGVRKQFEPVLVSEDSPDIIVFRLRPGAVCSGRIVHAKTGQPAPGVFVLTETGRGPGKFSDFTEEQWKRLERLGSYPAGDDEALAPVRRVRAFLDVVRTGADGRYEIYVDSGAGSYGLVCFARDFIPLQYRTAGLTGDSSGRVEIPPLRLYPAARVSMQIQTDLEPTPLSVRWLLKEDEVPSWAGGLCSRPADRRLPSYEYGWWYTPNVAQWVFVPAEVPLQLTVSTGPDDRLSPCTYPQLIYLPQGATMDLGPCSLPESLTVVLQVVDRAGKPLEGIPVKRRMGRVLSATHTTDENGLATLRVAPCSHGALGVFPSTLYSREAYRMPPETVPFEVGGVEDQGKQFTLVLSDELLAVLFARRGEPLN